ncbi:hypothetical protein Cycma_4166 [Cyclobacterium marinum DSM 745]|uniref:Uncharacterized protein n=1 Tax=Cyclobacterium marinum (strain ATCC 25205 / DSM 745 / LMG 13164 / NCIMB 1802) TaxID=880070 RepID=G0J890_CYCMS|nr:hypothetical protein Cycma_4166 [Cyclobacterium marinum DSM 745]
MLKPMLLIGKYAKLMGNEIILGYTILKLGILKNFGFYCFRNFSKNLY